MIIPVGYGQVTHEFSLLGSDQDAACTYGVMLEGVDFGENRVATLADLWDEHWTPQMSQGYVHTRTLLKYGPVSSGPVFEANPVEQGGAAGDAATPNVAILVRKRTASGGRSNRGRFYLPGVTEGVFNGVGIMASAVETVLQGVANDFLADLATNQMPMVILHSSSSDPTPVTNLSVDSTAATQRRRLR